MRVRKQIIGVTGAAGFIGSHLCEELIRRGFKVIALDDLSKGNLKNIDSIKNHQNFSFFKIDITSLSNASKVLKSTDVIVHLAAAKIPRYGNRLTTLRINTKGTENILEIACKNKAKVIFASTSDVYGKNSKLPFTEDSDLVIGSSEVARWSYAVSKIFGEHLCFAYWEKYQVPFVILRFFGTYGPHQHRSWWGGPQSLFIDNILNSKPVDIHGNGKQTRTFVYIDDVVEAIVKAISTKKADCQVLNIGSTNQISIVDLAKTIATLANMRLHIKKVAYISFSGKKYEDIKNKRPSILKAKKLIDWSPKINFEVGMTKTIAWHRKNPE